MIWSLATKGSANEILSSKLLMNLNFL